MTPAFRVGDRVRLLGLPDWLIHDLPEDEQRAMRSFVGRCTRITQIDAHGNPWVEFSVATEQPIDAARCEGHEFCISVEMLEPA